MRLSALHPSCVAGKHVPTDAAPTPGVRLLPLPGLSLRPAPDTDKRALSRFIDDNPDQSLVVCDCVHYTIHRNLAKVWLQALHLTP